MTLPFHKPKRGPEKGLSLAVFGKHPGWDDHIEDLGIETEQLIALRQTFYVDGIGGNVETGAWDKMDAGKRIPFHHVVAGPVAGGFVVGRLWASKDGKGRDKYPMVVFVQGSGFSPAWMLDYALPRLESLESRCRAALSAAEIRNIVSAERAELNEQAVDGGAVETLSNWKQPSELPAYLADREELGPNAAGWKRILYKLYREASAYAPGADASARRPQQLRVPRCADSLAYAAYVWGQTMADQLDASAPLLLMLPVEASWLDVLIGGPTVQQIHALQCAVSALPLTCDIPYNWESSFDRRLGDVLEASRRREATALSIFGPAETAEGGLEGWRRRIGSFFEDRKKNPPAG